MGGGGSIETPKVGKIQLQTSGYGQPIPIVFGRTRITGNLIWHSDFRAVSHDDTTGGKGGGITQTSYTYTAAIILAIAEGPIQGIEKVWVDGKVRTTESLGFTLITGNRTQAPWQWLLQHHPDKALGYAGTALACSPHLGLGTDGSLKNYSFEVTGFRSIPSPAPGYPDAHPADIIEEVLINPFFGAAWDPARLDSLASFRSYCTAAGFFMSPALVDQKQIIEHLATLLDATNSDAVWSGGILKILPYGDTEITGNGETYHPNTTPIYDLTLDDFVTSTALDGRPDPTLDAITIERTSLSDTFNVVPIRIWNRATDYNETPYEDPDNADIGVHGLRRHDPVEMFCVTRQEMALQLSRILAQRSLYTRNKYSFQLGWRFALLEPMDLVTLTDPNLGLDHVPVRIISIEEDEAGLLKVTAQDWPFGIASATLYNTEPGGPGTDYNADPGPINGPDIFDSPSLLSVHYSGSTAMGSEHMAEAIIAVSGGELWGGCEVWISETGDSYQRVGIINQRARHGDVTAMLPEKVVSTNPWVTKPRLDEAGVLEVQLATGNNALQPSTVDQRDAYVSLCWVGGELLSYKDVALVGPDRYQLTSLERAAYGTDSPLHDLGTRFVRIDEGVFRYPFPPEWVGKTLSVKLRSFNIYGGGLQALEDCAVYYYTPGAAAVDTPAPAACSLQITKTMPPEAAYQRRHSDEELLDGVVIRSGTAKGKKKRWVSVKWEFAEPSPKLLHRAFRVVLFHDTYNGSGDPNDERNYVLDPVLVKPYVREQIIRVAPADATSYLRAAVQVLYVNDRDSAWLKSHVNVVLGSEDTPLTGNGIITARNIIRKSDFEDGTYWNVASHDPGVPEEWARGLYRAAIVDSNVSASFPDPIASIRPNRALLIDNYELPDRYDAKCPTIWIKVPDGSPASGSRHFAKHSWLSFAFSIRCLGIGSQIVRGPLDVIFFTGPEIGDDTEQNYQLLGQVSSTDLAEMAGYGAISQWVGYAGHFRFPPGQPTRAAPGEYEYIGFRAKWNGAGPGYELDKVQVSKIFIDDLPNWVWTPNPKDQEIDGYHGQFDDDDGLTPPDPSQGRGGIRPDSTGDQTTVPDDPNA